MNSKNVVVPKRRFFLWQVLYEPSARRFVRRVSNRSIARRKEFLLLQLDSLPRRIPEHDIKTAVFEYFGEFQGPMEEVQPLRQIPSLANDSALNGPSRHGFENCTRCNRRRVASKALEKCSGPQVTSFLFSHPILVFMTALKKQLFAA